jgi:predicted AlkP superfamily phosphohydrolase/phosphomutase
VSRAPQRRLPVAVTAVLLLGPLLGGCRAAQGPPAVSKPPWIVIGVDGGERRVLERLWGMGRLPHLRRIADRGVFVRLATDYGISPVIWTTIATGQRPARHGITDFVVSTDAGDVPVSSAARKVPALWNMLTRAHRQVAVLGWWATWPAEPVAGEMVTDRVEAPLPQRAWPPELQADVARAVERARSAGLAFGGNPASETQDRVTTEFARRAVSEGYDLVLAYYRSVDLASHDHWRAFEPAAFGDPPSGRPGDDPVSRAYEAFDAAVGEILAAAPEGSNVLILSDHGFHATDGEQLQMLFDLDRVLEAVGLLVRDGPAVDPRRSRAFSYRSPDYRMTRLVRFAPVGTEPDPAKIRAETALLRRRLRPVRFEKGSALVVREPTPAERRRGAHAVVEIRAEAAGDRVFLGDRPIPGVVRHLGYISGSHGPHTDGIFLAAGPAIRPGAALRGISVHDVAPTILYALGLPVASDFAGAVRPGLFTESFRAAHPERKIASWGRRESGRAVRSPSDRKMLEELAGLGYLK